MGNTKKIAETVGTKKKEKIVAKSNCEAVTGVCDFLHIVLILIIQDIIGIC
jgi:hypothetical protein